MSRPSSVRLSSGRLAQRLAARRGLLVTAVIAALGPIVFLVSEAISALAWRTPRYDYLYNFISDLGTTVCGSEYSGRVMCSPLHAVMNVGFVTMGILIALAVTLVAQRVAGLRRVALLVIGWSIPVGMTLVATFPGGVESVEDGTVFLHVLGAGIAIIAGNTAAIVMGSNARALGFARWYRLTTVILGTVGLVGLVLTVAETALLTPAIFERVAVYSIFAWLFVTTAQLVVLVPRPGRMVK